MKTQQWYRLGPFLLKEFQRGSERPCALSARQHSTLVANRRICVQLNPSIKPGCKGALVPRENAFNQLPDVSMQFQLNILSNGGGKYKASLAGSIAWSEERDPLKVHQG